MLMLTQEELHWLSHFPGPTQAEPFSRPYTSGVKALASQAQAWEFDHQNPWKNLGVVVHES